MLNYGKYNNKYIFILIYNNYKEQIIYYNNLWQIQTTDKLQKLMRKFVRLLQETVHLYYTIELMVLNHQGDINDSLVITSYKTNSLI